ncbi:DUF1642 domain-containing protein [Streptococcus gordonii]|uniref:DUF1642 domain-containing protein n=1 Tax=Streptococcus gordonii TaxID=1302 RepID=UPI001C8C6158|nr:DUF1642 domain-containing protein [Streptococcus gordonii]MBX9096410.1 DUF1642 domain-containing protein [Streptococcus gordonii]
MNKQELIERIEDLKNLFGNKAEYIEIDAAIELVSKLNEPQKPVVPPLVADWYEDIVDEFYIVLERLVLNYQNNTNMPICKWFFETEDALKILINMHQFGYEVEKEKRYYVRLKGVDENYNYFNCIKHLNEWVLTEIKTDKKFRTEHTRKQLEEAGFGWVFDCEGIELEEVTE